MTKILALLLLRVMKRAIRIFFSCLVFPRFFLFIPSRLSSTYGQWSVSVIMFGTRLFGISVVGF